MQGERVSYSVLGAQVTIEPAAGVFLPSRHGSFYASAVHVEAGERVIDVGTGSGILAIAAAARGASVVATDVDERAIAAAARNASLNGVSVELRLGALFAGTRGTFDVVIANLPNEIVAPAHLASLSPADSRTFAGGERGNEQLLALLAAAPAYMHASSRLYLGVHGLTDYRGTLRAALRSYRVRLLDLAALPVKAFVTENLPYYTELARTGMIQLHQSEDGEWRSDGYVYELRLA
jgi:methylase of polypeptide subunit release factors